MAVSAEMELSYEAFLQGSREDQTSRIDSRRAHDTDPYELLDPYSYRIETEKRAVKQELSGMCDAARDLLLLLQSHMGPLIESSELLSYAVGRLEGRVISACSELER